MLVHSEKGFTLIELVLTLIIIILLGGSISLGLSSLSSARLDQAVNKVIADLRYAQQLAINTQSRHGMTVNSTGQYTIHRDLPPDTAVLNPINLGAPFVVSFSTYQQGQLSGVIFSSASPFCGGAGNVMEFNSIGAPTDTSGTVLTCNSSLTMSYGGNTRTIMIQQKTGNLT
jgi:prepilin-type N-terminal cleavage/methylation domain-containing protein